MKENPETALEIENKIRSDKDKEDKEDKEDKDKNADDSTDITDNQKGNKEINVD